MPRNMRQADRRLVLESGTKALSIGTRLVYRRNEIVFSQGEPADSIYFLERGRIKLSAVSECGRQATICLLTPGVFFGESCLAYVPKRRQSATAISDCVVIRIARSEFTRIIHEQQPLSDFFVSQIVERNAQFEEDLLNLLFNSSERRLARTLLLLAHFDAGEGSEKTISGINQETLAQMIGTTRAHVTVFMNKFRKMGFIDYDRHAIRVRASLINRLLGD